MSHPSPLADGHSACMFLNDWARASRRQQLAVSHESPCSASLLSSSPIMDRSSLLLRCEFSRQVPPSEGKHSGGSGGSWRHETDRRGFTDLKDPGAPSTNTGTVMLDLTANAATKQEMSTVKAQQQLAERHPAGGKAAFDVRSALGRREQPLPACLALQQLPSGRWLSTLQRAKQVVRFFQDPDGLHNPISSLFCVCVVVIPSVARVPLPSSWGCLPLTHSLTCISAAHPRGP